MPLTKVGSDFLSGSTIGAPTTNFFDNAHANLGVGDSTAVFDVTQVDLQACDNKIRKPMDINFPVVNLNVVTFESTFGSAEANWPWQEWGIFNAPTDGVMLTRKVEYNGTKLAGQTWILQVEITFDVGA
jgi:hypothetical protein